MKKNGSIIICLILLLIIAFSLNFPQNISAQVFTFQWGAAGPGQGQFNQPVGIAFDTLGNVYVADAGNNRVQ
jgi:DNA-binding beta-propeller fold protein YncE